MPKHAIDDPMRLRLNGSNEEVEFRDRGGETLSFFLPATEHECLKPIAKEHERLLDAWAHGPFSEEDLDRPEGEQEDLGTEEVLKHPDGR